VQTVSPKQALRIVRHATLRHWVTGLMLTPTGSLKAPARADCLCRTALFRQSRAAKWFAAPG